MAYSKTKMAQMSMNIVVSIAMTTYNGGKYLSEQLDSLYSQTVVPDEVVVVDDRSTDNTIAILEKYHIRYGLKYFVNSSNLGVNKNFEVAIRKCSGNYVMLCDQDDIWLPEKIEKSLIKMQDIEKSNVPSLVTSKCINVDESGRILRYPTDNMDSNHFSSALFFNSMQGCTLMMNRSLVEQLLPFPADKNIMYDAYIGISAAMIGNKYDLAEPLMYYRHHGTNVSAGRNSHSLLASLNRYRLHYAGFISSLRYDILTAIEERHAAKFKIDRADLFKQMKTLSGDIPLSRKFQTVMHIPQLTVGEKARVLFSMMLTYLINRTRIHVSSI